VTLTSKRARADGKQLMNDETLNACVRGFQNEMVDFTSELVGIATENPPGNAYPECVRAIASRLQALNFHVRS
jgi:hypothetical protein